VATAATTNDINAKASVAGKKTFFMLYILN
jgi:hypothetical protein